MDQTMEAYFSCEQIRVQWFQGD